MELYYTVIYIQCDLFTFIWQVYAVSLKLKAFQGPFLNHVFWGLPDILGQWYLEQQY